MKIRLLDSAYREKKLRFRFCRRNGVSPADFDLTAYSQEDMQKKEIRLEMGRRVDGQTKTECGE